MIFTLLQQTLRLTFFKVQRHFFQKFGKKEERSGDLLSLGVNWKSWFEPFGFSRLPSAPELKISSHPAPNRPLQQ